jgi:hypothetical protein
MVTLADYQIKMREKIESLQTSILDRAEALLNGTGIGQYNMHTITEDGSASCAL